MHILRGLNGVVIWVALSALAWWNIDRQLTARGIAGDEFMGALWDFGTGERARVELEIAEPIPLAVGDPIFFVDEASTIRQVGEITELRTASGTEARFGREVAGARAMFYPNAPELTAADAIDYYATDNSVRWVLETMLPQEKQAAIAHEMATAIERHQAEILTALRPIAEASLMSAMEVLEEDLPAALVRHRRELEHIGARYQRELVDRDIVPLVRREVWPIVRRHSEPVLNQIGMEMWERVSLWSFTWRYLYDVSPLPARNRFAQEWARFVENEGLPIIERHTDDIVRIVQRSLVDTARNRKVRSAVRENALKMLQDEELQGVVWKIFREVIVDNPKLKAILKEQWTSPEAHSALQLASARLEPTARRIGDMLLGTREGGITPEFARVLRNQVLDKDRRWLVLRSNRAATSESASPAIDHNSSIPVQRSRASMPFPAIMTRTGAADAQKQ